MKNSIEVVKVLIENNEEFLVLQKSDSYDWKAGKWELPGGKVEEGEDKFEASKREVRAETGLEIEDLSKVVRVETEEEDEDKPVVDCWILHTDEFSGDIKLSGEHQDFRWVSAAEFREMDWHRDAGYAIPAMQYLDQYLKEE